MLNEFLENKPLYYDKIDYTRMPRVYESIKKSFNLPKIIHIIGTNGKGTTGRFLASALCSKGFNVGHYTSPHILIFNERIWLNGFNVTESLLNAAHVKLRALLSKEDANALSYFEYTTLLAMFIYQNCDYVVLEAGLGGEFDATAVFDNILTLVTPIDFDHEAFLGNSIKEIATTKLNAVKTRAILGKQKHQEVAIIAQEIAEKRYLEIESYEKYLLSDDLKKIDLIAKENTLVEYLQDNLSLSIAALNYLGISYKVEDFSNSKLFGRLSKIGTNILLDVGHNTLAATSIAKSLKNKKYTLIYNSYKDKDYKQILAILKPIVLNIEIIEVNEDRIEDTKLLKNTIAALGVECSDFSSIKKEKNYLVFGSFSVAQEFLKKYKNG
ncbi:bifunctional folylpolyglutamate synthase/dihydrofolate synthase [Sulfurimonas sp.]